MICILKYMLIKYEYQQSMMIEGFSGSRESALRKSLEKWGLL